MKPADRTAPDAGAGAPRGRVCLVDDEGAVRRSLGLLLRLHGYATAEFSSAEDFLEAASPEQPACAVVDLRLGGMDGLQLLARLRASGDARPVVLVSAHGDAALARRALLQGASDFLEKPIDGDALLAAVEAALRSDAARLAVRRESEREAARLAELTPPERILFDGITGGRPSRDIAAQLGLSPADLETQRARLMEKLQARRLADLFRLRFRADAGAAR
jgi:two-component system response regulator FixJ